MSSSVVHKAAPQLFVKFGSRLSCLKGVKKALIVLSLVCLSVISSVTAWRAWQGQSGQPVHCIALGILRSKRSMRSHRWLAVSSTTTREFVLQFSCFSRSAVSKTVDFTSQNFEDFLLSESSLLTADMKSSLIDSVKVRRPAVSVVIIFAVALVNGAAVFTGGMPPFEPYQEPHWPHFILLENNNTLRQLGPGLRFSVQSEPYRIQQGR